jgi:hypothetical protein
LFVSIFGAPLSRIFIVFFAVSFQVITLFLRGAFLANSAQAVTPCLVSVEFRFRFIFLAA